jgi:hypothetical protein
MHDLSDTGHRTPDTGHRTPDTGHRTPDTGHRTPDVRPADEAVPRPTLTVDRRVLAVARTVPATRRVLDLLAVVDGDRRVGVTFAYDAGSAFGTQVPDLLAAAGVAAVPFDRAVDEPWDLALTASANGPLHRLSAPVFVVPHGAGHSRRLTPGGSAPVLGMSPDQLMHDGRVVPAVIGLPHPDDARRLAEQCPPALPRAEIIGDPCWDRLLASRHRRAQYRGAFGLGRERLVVVSSTWGPASLFARHPDLVERLTADLPWDDYRVALVLHPAVRAWHSEHQVRRWLRPALDRGLMLLSPDDEWRAAVVAADAVIGDHGSVTLYSAALGRPTALACFSWEEIAPDTPMAALTGTAPGFAAEKPVWPQVEALIEAAGRGPGLVAEQAEALAARSFDHQGRSLDRISTVAYRLMSLPAPERSEQAVAVPLPSRPDSAPTSWYFQAEIDEDEVTILRWPAPWSPPDAGSGKARLLVDVFDPNPRLVRAATVLIQHAEANGEADAEAEIDLADYPAASVRAIVHPGRVILTLRGQGTFEAVTDRLPPGFDPRVIAAAAHAMVFQARRPLGPELRISVSRRTATVPVRAASSPSPCPAT